ncbi:MAG TPA: winged helix-turn-helix domain-containing protein, partial [Bryobacteraceae bacterium]|nr:winged helix-turn-helix domain-containing protein [Bryobacteraceae bacterium]
MGREFNTLYGFGSFRLDIASRTLTRDAQPVHLAPKTFHLLALFVESDGRLLSKQELIRALWDESFVEEGNLTYQISTLRKALGAEGSRWIETVPKAGYRFNAPVIRLTAAPDPGVDPRSVAGAGSRRVSARRALLLSGVVIVLAASILLWWRPKSGTRDSPVLPQPLTTYPGSEVNPSFSPHGNQIAFQWNGAERDNEDIYVMSIGAPEPLRLTTTPELDTNPSWSPDGRLIAFLRQVTASEYFDILIVPATGGRERKLTRIHSPLWGRRALAKIAWAPDGLTLTAAQQLPGEESMSLVSFPLSSANPARITRPPGNSPGDGDPAYSPDGKTVAFLRQSSSCEHQLMLVPASGGDARQVAHRGSNGPVRTALAWARDGRELIWAHGGQLWRVPVDGSPVRLIVEAGSDVVDVAVSRDGHHVVYARESEDKDIWSLDVGNPGPEPKRRPEPKRLISSTRAEGLARFSPDGRSIAFASDRSGAFEIWVADADGSNPLRVTDIGKCGAPRWSHDGQWIAFDSAASGNPEIYIVSASGGRSRRMTNHPAEDVIPAWSPDGRWIYFTSNRTGSDQIWKIDARSDGEPSTTAAQTTRKGGAGATVSPDGAFLYYARRRYGEENSLLRVPLRGGPEQVLVPAFTSGWWGYSLSSNYLYYADFERKQDGGGIQWKLRRLEPNRRSSEEVADLPVPFVAGRLGHTVDASP